MEMERKNYKVLLLVSNLDGFTGDVYGSVFCHSVIPMIVHDEPRQKVVEVPSTKMDALHVTQKNFLSNN